jgi:arsenate reductase-like glutaredoxin family protein
MGLARPNPPVQPILYTQAGCAESAKVRAWLTEHGIRFRERTISADPEEAAALAATGVFATPLLIMGGATVVGFRPHALAALLDEREP